MNFFAAPDDGPLVLDWAFEAGLEVLESYSEYDAPLRPRFHSTTDVVGTLFVLWRPEHGGKVLERRIALTVPGHEFRWSREGWGLVQLHFGRLEGATLKRSSLSVNSEKRARRWEPTYPHLGKVDAWEWPAITRLVRRYEAYLRRRSVSQQLGGHVLPGAAAYELSQ